MSDSALNVGPRAWRRRSPRWAPRALALSVAGGLFGQGALVVSGILVARSLGPTDRGHLALLTVIATGLAFVANAGVPDALAYHISRDRPAARTLARRLLPLALAQAALLVAVQASVLGAVVHGERPAVELAALLTLGFTPSFVGYQYGLAVLQAERRFVAFNFLRVIPVTSYTGLVVLVVAAGHASIPAFAGAWTAAYAAAGATAATLAVRATRGSRGPSNATLREIAAFGVRGAVGQVSFAETFRVDQLVAGLFLGAAPLGLYAVGSAFTTLTMGVAVSISMVEYPHVASQDDRATGRRIVLRYLALTLAVSAVIVAALELMLPVLVPWLFGSDYAPAVPVARLLVVAGIAFATRRIVSDGLRALGRPAAGTLAEIVSWATLVPLLALLAPLFGITGVAAAVAISAGVGVLILGVMLVRSADLQGPRRPRLAPEGSASS